MRNWQPSGTWERSLVVRFSQSLLWLTAAGNSQVIFSFLKIDFDKMN